MIPLSDRPPRRRTLFPLMNIVLILVNVLVFLYELTLTPDQLEAFVQAWGVIPREILTGRDIPPTIGVPVWATLITSMFIHGGLLHIAGNMLFLWIFGDNVEDAFGHLGYLLFYFATGIAASGLHVLFNSASTLPSVGASGAIAGVLGAYLLYFPGAEVRTLLFILIFFTVTRLRAVVLIGVWFILQLLNGLASVAATEQTTGVAYLAHVGGFVAGLVLAFVFRSSTRLGKAPISR